MPRKRNTAPKNDSNSVDLVAQDVIEEAIADCVSNPNDLRRQKLVTYMILGCSFKDAALKAGYTESYAKARLYKSFRNGPKFREIVDSIASKAPERYRQICQLRLGAVAEIEQAALNEYLCDPKLAIDKPQLLKHVKQAAKVLGDEMQEQNYIFINSAQIMAGQLYTQSQDRPQLTANDFVDAEYEEAEAD